MLRVIGLMSGTSLDGVDAAWLETDGVRIGALGPRLTLPYDDRLRADLRRLLDPRRRWRRMTGGEDGGGAADRRPCARGGGDRAAGGPDRVSRPDHPAPAGPARRTWQIGDAAWLARRTGVRVAWDFRSADVAAGGEGAPLAPVFHAALADALPRPLAVLNIGGVANVTWIGAEGAVLACDTGPGNGPLDDWVARHTGAAFDRDGRAGARRGGGPGGAGRGCWRMRISPRPAPKSLDRLDFATALAASGIAALSAADGAATLVAFTAGAVAATRLPAAPLRWLVGGGGRHNPAIMAALRLALGVPVDPVEAVGWDGDALEAQCFGFLAARVAAGLPLSFPGTTGVKRALPGGRIAEP